MGWDSDRDNPPSEAAVDDNQLRADFSCKTRGEVELCGQGRFIPLYAFI